MLVRFGNERPHRCVGGPSGQHRHEAIDTDAPLVTYLHIPEGDGGHTFDPNVDLNELRSHIDGVDPFDPDSWNTQRPDDEALISILHPIDGSLAHHGHRSGPSWVWSDNPDMQAKLAEWFNVPAGMPDDVEDTHYTISGPPGVGGWAGPLAPTSLKVNAGNDIQAALLGGGQVDVTGQASAATATTLTGTGFSASAYIGCRVYATVSATQIVWGLVVSNTTTVLTVDRWYTVGTPGGAAGSTPSSTATYVIVGSGGAAAWFMGLTATATAAAGTDTSLTGEITTSGGGLIRKICPYAHTAGTNTYTLTPVFTANGTDALPVTIAAIGVFNSMVSTDTATTLLFHTVLTTTATLSASGDQLTITETVTM